MKKVLLIIIDALTSRVVVPAMEAGKLPHLKALVEAGSFDPACTSIFPSITHAATASIATGRYPEEHGIAGAHWYNIDTDDPVYYASDFWVILNRGLAEFFEDFVFKLNHQWLKADTIFQKVERAGLKAACINHIIFRGDVCHKLNVPELLTWLPGVPLSEEVYGPSMLCIGDFISIISEASETVPGVGGMLHRFGLEDNYTADVLIELAKEHRLPDFTLAYFPDNDDVSHRNGPENALTVIENVDKRLGNLYDVYGGMEQMLEELCIILTGDHSQSDILAGQEEAGIWLDQILSGFSLAEAGRPWSSQDLLVACPNLRMAQIYFKHQTRDQLEEVVARLLVEERVDQVLWRGETFDEKTHGYYVATGDRGRLHFWPGHEGRQTAVDQHANVWSWWGDLGTVTGEVLEGNVLNFPDYPNAFERIQGGLKCPTGGHLWVTARPGYEFYVTNMSVHVGGGSHGSLHAVDSIVPLVLAGAPDGVKLPEHPRIVDLVPLCLKILGLK